MSLTSEAQWAVSLTVAGTPVQEVFDSWEGGDTTAEIEAYAGGGMAVAESLVSTPVTSEITISRAWRGDRDAAIERWLRARIGHPVVVSKQALKPDRTPVPGGLTTYRGKIAGVTTPTHDSMGRSVVRFAVTIAPDGLPS